jgi:hypothetical protein
VCSTCEQETEVYSRIVGYYRPIKNWNDGKRAEFSDRKEFIVDKSLVNNTNTTEPVFLSPVEKVSCL